MAATSAIVPAPRWFAVHTESQAETLATHHLRRQGYGVLYLRYPQEIRHARKIRVAFKPFFARYLFAAVDETQVIGPIARTIGVSSIVSAAQEPLTVPQDIITELQARADQDGLLAPPSARSRSLLATGSHVQIISGPLTGFPGIVVLDEGNRIRIDIKLLGRYIEASIDPNAVTATPPALRSAP